ncbi:NYN domain-containing protein [Acinetobacter sp. 194]|uniref:NYN domain-containing protein n=1 Tax=Acinetobacter shaoyimingii TaxID=2715164 RepID=UPI00140DD144|nr:NYN domain-containing protein [Acinetobacter shaoyimingii]NHB58574.1 NYN domain-containing protein [Acinetobacter shaoyimingii]
MEIQTKKLAVLIDADNSSVSSIAPILEEVAKYGIASVKRVYGDWSSETLKNWRDILLPNAITPVQQFAYTAGKDATDMGMIIDAMDLLYAGALDGFCIISSDSDFTPLASRIRESGLVVYGFGRKKTPEAFRKACDKFIYIENLIIEDKTISEVKTTLEKPTEHKEENTQPQKSKAINTNTTTATTAQELKKAPEKASEKETNVEIEPATLHLIYKAVKDNSDDNGWANLSVVGQYISMVKPDFDARNYGRAKLSGLIKMLELFETKIEGSQMYLRKVKK